MVSDTSRTHQPIRILPAAVAARIAAGESIERPASVVKELVENALDAGASQIRVDVRGGGLTLIRAGDDGIGIPAADLRLACQRHATSKLHEDDLSRVQTLGFRGEALPSIASVAELTLVSATDDSGVGRRITLRDGQITGEEPAPRPRGTTVTVRQLFQNVPARLATIDRPQTEAKQIGQIMRRLALAVPEVRFKLFIEGRQTFQTSGSGDLAHAMTEVYGASLSENLLPLGPVDVAGARIWGVVGGPELTRAGRNQVNLIVNGRSVQPRGLHASIERAYRQVLPPGRHPVLTLAIQTAPDLLDINIHPSKLEVKLLNERSIGVTAGDMVRDALGKQPLLLRLPPGNGLTGLDVPAFLSEGPVAGDDPDPIVTPGLPPLRLLGQVQNRLLLLEGTDGLYLIDQHRAHERILYDRLSAARQGDAGSRSVPLPEPLLLQLGAHQAMQFGERLEDLAAIGFQCEDFGGQTYLLRSAPTLPGVLQDQTWQALDGLGEADGLAATLLTLADEETAGRDNWQDQLLINMACRTAVRRGRPLDRAAMRALVDELGRTSIPAICPHGSPLLMHLSGTLLERQFGWR